MNPSSFSGTTMGTPRWAGDFRGREQLVPWGARLDPTQFYGIDAVRVTVATGGAAQGATSIPVTALTGPIPTGTLLDFGGAKFARMTTAAAAAATTLTVAALPTALVATDTTMYRGTGLITVPSGTYIGRTLAERDAGTGYGPAATTDDERYLIAFDVTDASKNPDCELYRHLMTVKENYLPGWTALSAPIKAAIRADYTCTLGAE